MKYTKSRLLIEIYTSMRRLSDLLSEYQNLYGDRDVLARVNRTIQELWDTKFYHKDHITNRST